MLDLSFMLRPFRRRDPAGHHAKLASPSGFCFERGLLLVEALLKEKVSHKRAASERTVQETTVQEKFD